MRGVAFNKISTFVRRAGSEIGSSEHVEVKRAEDASVAVVKQPNNAACQAFGVNKAALEHKALVQAYIGRLLDPPAAAATPAPRKRFIAKRQVASHPMTVSDGASTPNESAGKRADGSDASVTATCVPPDFDGSDTSFAAKPMSFAAQRPAQPVMGRSIQTSCQAKSASHPLHHKPFAAMAYDSECPHTNILMAAAGNSGPFCGFTHAVHRRSGAQHHF